jgi:chaperonin GroES
MAIKFKPLQDRVIVQRLEEEEKTKGGIIIPDTAKEKPAEVLFGKYSGTEVKIEGDEYLIMREDDMSRNY